jgi:hypothetical protein
VIIVGDVDGEENGVKVGVEDERCGPTEVL